MADKIVTGGFASIKYHDNGDGSYSEVMYSQNGGGGLVNNAYDYMAYTNTSTTVDTYVYKSGGVSGTVVSTVTITYTDTTKSQVSTVVRT